MMAYDAIMKARLVHRERVVYSTTELAEIVVWEVPSPVPPSRHSFKYRLAYVVGGVRILGYDNERGKGDHRHFRGTEKPFEFMSVGTLLDGFATEVEELRSRETGS
jgi:Family of unknown function (DUF6516)